MPNANAIEYRRTLVEGRTKQLETMYANLVRLQDTFDRAAASIVDQINQLPDERYGTAWHRAKLRTLNYVHNVINALDRDYENLLQAGMIETAQTAAGLQAAATEIVGAPEDPNLTPNLTRTLTLSTGDEVAVTFGRTAIGAIERVTQRYYSDGLVLSDRIYNMTEGIRKVVENTITQGIIEQVGARTIGRRMEAALSEAGSANPRYHAMRIARTELNNAHREASVLSTLTPGGQLKDFILGIRWMLSAGHPEVDICDAYASYDSGNGSGIYQPGEVPIDHPHGLCWIYAVLRDYPDVVGPGKVPASIDEIPDSQLQYYAKNGDGVAAAIVAQKEAALNTLVPA